MWTKPSNIPATDWQELTNAWIDRRDNVYARFHSYDASVNTDDIDRIMAGLLGLYYKAEQNAEQNASFAIQLSDEFHKGFWIEGQIKQLELNYPALQQPERVRYQDEIEEGTAADKCMGGIIAAFIGITRSVCTERFGKPFGDKDKALRNGVLERSSWGHIMEDYARQYGKYREQLKSDPSLPEPSIYRQ